MEDGASFAPPHLPPVDAYIPSAAEPYGPRMGSRAVAAFRACLPNTYDGSTLPYQLGNWLHQLESIFLSFNASPIPLTEEEQCFHFWQGLLEQVRARVYVGTRPSFDHLIYEVYYVQMGLQEECHVEEERRELD
ncbi:hypothetical protein TIFTF001_031250 [Ficus carica]|uniref:Uncharacterized protein n=1 Tax=Ficus carica TaxID=3494 RepID=A0AA88DW12_FICCA|nr:hypothetical protein TIFTF001_031250 [Ficus carica]